MFTVVLEDVVVNLHLVFSDEGADATETLHGDHHIFFDDLVVVLELELDLVEVVELLDVDSRTGGGLLGGGLERDVGVGVLGVPACFGSFHWR